jgi:hypothetical protein
MLRPVLATFLAAALAGCGSSAPASDGRGTYWCVVGAADNPRVGSCSRSRMSCESKRRSDEPGDTQLRCEQTTTLLYEARWEGQYGPMEAWYVDRATCERVSRTFWRTDAPCEPSPWEERGQRAH